jgi:hypothetical protein
MREIRSMGSRGLLAFVCSLLIGFQPVFADRAEPNDAPESIAVAKLSGAADRNGQPLLNGSIVSSGDLLSTHGDSALLLTSTPQERMWLGPNTRVKLTKDGGNVAVALERGTLGFQTHGRLQVSLENHEGVALRSRSNSPALAQLSLVNNQEAQVRLQEGSLELVQGDHSVLLQPDSSAPISYSGATSGNGQGAAENSGSGSLKGTVVNSKLFVIPDATVTLTPAVGTPLSTTSNIQGAFSFDSVPVGSYTLRVTRQGYQNYELPNVVVRAGNGSSFYVQMAGGGVASAKNNNVLLWVVIGGGAAAAAGIGIALGSKGSSSSSSPSTP